MLHVCGGPSALTTPRVRSQVGMLLWYDLVCYLVILPYLTALPGGIPRLP
jgi:hypothetical protein